MSTERAEFSTKRDAVAAESDESLDKLTADCGSRDCVKGLMRSFDSQSIKALELFDNQVGTQKANRLRVGFEGACAGSGFSCPYPWTHLSGVEARSVEVHFYTPHGGVDGDAAAAYPFTPDPSRLSTLPAKGSRFCSKKARLYCVTHCLRFSLSLLVFVQ